MGVIKVQKLIKDLDSKDWSVQMRAAKELGNLGDKTAVPALIKTLLNFMDDDWVAQESAIALGKIADTRAVQPLSQILNSQALINVDNDLHRQAKENPSQAVGLAMMSYDIDLLYDKVVKALKSIGTDEALKVVSHWEAHENEQ